MINSLKEIFNQGNAKFEENDGKYYLELKFSGIGISKKSVIELIKCESKKSITLEDRIKALETNYNILLEKNKNNDIKEMVRDILQEKEIKNNLFQEMEQIFLSKYNLIAKENEKKQDIDIEKIVNNEMKKKEEILIEKIKQEEKQIIAGINEIKNIKQELLNNEAKKMDILNNNNFIILKVDINKNNINKNIRLLNQENTYKHFFMKEMI